MVLKARPATAAIPPQRARAAALRRAVEPALKAFEENETPVRLRTLADAIRAEEPAAREISTERRATLKGLDASVTSSARFRELLGEGATGAAVRERKVLVSIETVLEGRDDLLQAALRARRAEQLRQSPEALAKVPGANGNVDWVLERAGQDASIARAAGLDFSAMRVWDLLPEPKAEKAETGFELAKARDFKAIEGRPVPPHLPGAWRETSVPRARLTQFGAKPGGEAVQLGSHFVEDMEVRIRQIVHPTNGAGTELNFKLTAEASRTLADELAAAQVPKGQFRLEAAEFKDGALQLMAGKDYVPSNATAFVVDQPGKFTAEFLPAKGNGQVFDDRVRLRVYGKTDLEREAN